MGGRRLRTLLYVSAAVIAALAVTGISAAAGSPRQPGPQADGSVLVTDGRTITPAGIHATFSGRPTAVAVSPDGRTAAVLTQGPNSHYTPGFHPINVVDLSDGHIIQQFDDGDPSSSYAGIAYSPDGQHLYASASDGRILDADVSSTGTLSNGSWIDLPDGPQGNPYPGGLAVSPDGGTLYAALSRSNQLGVIDTATGKQVAAVPTGNAPYSVLLDGGIAYVSDQGGRPANPGEFTEHSAGTAIVADQATGRPATGAVTAVDTATRAVVASIPAGLQPTGMALDGHYLLVTATSSDAVDVIDTRSNTVVRKIPVTPFPNAPYGSQPDAVAVLPGNRLAVALAGDNALAIYNWTTPQAPAALDGLVPTAWLPGDLALDTARGSLVVADVRGQGDLGPLVTRTSPIAKATGHYTHAYLGEADIIGYPGPQDLAQGTARVSVDNHWNRAATSTRSCGGTAASALPFMAKSGQRSPIKHVFYIIKENNSYDSILGDDPRGNGDPALADLGGNLTPNHHALANQFVLLDNTYVSGEDSANGHQWDDQADDSAYLEKETFDQSSPRSYPSAGGDPLAYLPSGFLWEDATRCGLWVRDFGEYADQFTGPSGTFGDYLDWYHDAMVLEGKQQGPLTHPLGQWQAHSDVPSNDPLLERDYPPFDLRIPDQYRTDIWLRDFQHDEATGQLPNLEMLWFSNDHTDGYTPDQPTPQAAVADNDYALGRVVDAISHSRFWESSAIFVIEDDTQNAVDHVDGARTPAYVISPWVKHGMVDSSFHTTVDMVRTIEDVLGLPAMNQEDIAASPMSELFGATADQAPYDAVPNQAPLDQVNPSPSQIPSALPGATPAQLALARSWSQWSAQALGHGSGLSHPDIADPDMLNHAKWYALHQFRTPYPGDHAVLTPGQVRTAEHGSGK